MYGCPRKRIPDAGPFYATGPGWGIGSGDDPLGRALAPLAASHYTRRVRPAVAVCFSTSLTFFAEVIIPCE